MYVETFYDKGRDKGVTVPGLCQNIDDVIETGVVKDLGLELEYNMIEDGSVEGRPEDVFQAIEYARKKALNAVSSEAPSSLNNQPASAGGGVTPEGGDEA